MGAGQSSENIVENICKSLVQSTSESAMASNASSSSMNIVRFDNCKDIHGVTINQKGSINITNESLMQAMQDASVDSSITNSVKQAVDQALQNVSFNFTVQEAKQITKNTMELAVQMQNSISMNCDVSTVQANVVECTNSSGLSGIQVTQETLADILINCSLQSKQTSSAKTSLTNTIDQMLSQKQEDAILSLALLVLACAALVAAPIASAGYAGSKMLNNKAGQFFLAGIFLMTTNIYLYKECMDHIYPVAHIPVLGWGIFPKWCDSNTKTAISFGTTWFIFAVLFYALYRSDSSSSSTPSSSSKTTSTTTPKK